MRNWHPGIQITCLHVAIGQWVWERGLVILRGFLPHNNLQKYPNALWAIFPPILVHYGAQTFWQEPIHIFLSAILSCINGEFSTHWKVEKLDLSPMWQFSCYRSGQTWSTGHQKFWADTISVSVFLCTKSAFFYCYTEMWNDKEVGGDKEAYVERMRRGVSRESGMGCLPSPHPHYLA